MKVLCLEVVSRRAVGAARRGEDEALHARLFRESRQLHRCQMVNVLGELGVEIARWIIRQSSQVHDRVEAFQIRPGVDLAP